ncbi:MAG: hypothetical protein CL942_14220 [Desulfovibrio sp.]|nr:hypothetical protein [Desulfovibrio sp.]|tara:strand:+ start:1795 stop:2001 length:207 start_codon:yes stop_codon:yes gene_type:complete
MEHPNRFQVKRDGANGAVVKDIQTGRIVATFHPDPDHAFMARRFADAAADEFNRRHAARLASRKKMGL